MQYRGAGYNQGRGVTQWVMIEISERQASACVYQFGVESDQDKGIVVHAIAMIM